MSPIHSLFLLTTKERRQEYRLVNKRDKRVKSKWETNSPQEFVVTFSSAPSANRRSILINKQLTKTRLSFYGRFDPPLSLLNVIYGVNNRVSNTPLSVRASSLE